MSRSVTLSRSWGPKIQKTIKAPWFFGQRPKSDPKIPKSERNEIELSSFHQSIPLEKLEEIPFLNAKNGLILRFLRPKTVSENNKMHPTFYSPTFFKI